MNSPTPTGHHLLLKRRIDELLQWLLPKSERFPKSYRNTLTLRLMNTALDLNEATIHALRRRGRSRQSALQQADEALECLRSYLLLVFEWRWISIRQYEHVCGLLMEIGRLLGGWIKKARQPNKITE